MYKLKIKSPKLKITMKKSKAYQDKNGIVFVSLLIVLGILFRTTWHLAPNVEFVTTATLLSAAYLGKRWLMIVPIAIMFISDLIIGNTNIFLFTWSAYLLIGLVASYSFKFKILNLKFKIITATVLGVVASLWFFLWTNFGVWLLDSWGMYERTLSGLLHAYIMGLPFLRYNLIGNIVFVPISFLLVELVRFYIEKFDIRNNKYIKKQFVSLIFDI